MPTIHGKPYKCQGSGATCPITKSTRMVWWKCHNKIIHCAENLQVHQKAVNNSGSQMQNDYSLPVPPIFPPKKPTTCTDNFQEVPQVWPVRIGQPATFILLEGKCAQLWKLLVRRADDLVRGAVGGTPFYEFYTKKESIDALHQLSDLQVHQETVHKWRKCNCSTRYYEFFPKKHNTKISPKFCQNQMSIIVRGG